jgi:nucleotide-binding universal stress UspA family protein
MQIDEKANEALARKAAGYMDDVAVRYSTLDFMPQAVVRHGPTAETILEYAGETGADLIAMATHGRTGLRRWVYGSITEKVLRGAHAALLVVRVPPHLLHEEPVREELTHAG